MNHYVCQSNDQHAVNAVQLAEQIIQLYLDGKREASLKITLDFFNELNFYLFHKTDFVKPTQANHHFNELESLFTRKIKEASEVKWNEYNLAFLRAKFFAKGLSVKDYGYDHNASFIDWFIYDIGLIKKENRRKELSEKRGRILKENNFIFNREKEEQYKGRAKLFYRNAYRAEMYSHKIYTDIDKKGFYDMYTPLILTRMGVEQYLKAMYENTFHSQALEKPSSCRKELKKNKIISDVYSNEIFAILQRGNVNTHEGYASYPFAIIHGLAVLKECLQYFNKNNK